MIAPNKAMLVLTSRCLPTLAMLVLVFPVFTSAPAATEGVRIQGLIEAEASNAEIEGTRFELRLPRTMARNVHLYEELSQAFSAAGYTLVKDAPLVITYTLGSGTEQGQKRSAVEFQASGGSRSGTDVGVQLSLPSKGERKSKSSPSQGRAYKFAIKLEDQDGNSLWSADVAFTAIARDDADVAKALSELVVDYLGRSTLGERFKR